MGKNQFDKMMEDADFAAFYKELQTTANYFVADNEKSQQEDRHWAFWLCLAAAYEAGSKKRRPF